MKKIYKLIFFLILINAKSSFAWEINCDVIDKSKNKVEDNLTFTSSYSLKESKKVNFSNSNLFLKIEKSMTSNQSLLSIRNYDTKSKGKMERIWTVGRYINLKKIPKNHFNITFKTNDRKIGLLKCNGN